MKRSSLPFIALIVVQPASMYLFLRVLELGFFSSAALSALAAALAAFGVSRLVTPAKGV